MKLLASFPGLPFFRALPPPCIILNASRGTKKKRGRPGNEAMKLPSGLTEVCCEGETSCNS